MADLRISEAPLLQQDQITGGIKVPTGGNGNYAIQLSDLAWYVVNKENLTDVVYVDTAVGNVNSALQAHITDKANPHQVTKAQVGLDQVNNTADLDKPVSNATRSAIITATTGMATRTYVNSQDGDLTTLLTIKKSNLVSAINEVVSVKADKATTLVGYGISDAYTKSEIDTDFSGIKTLYDKNVQAGAGANGWADDLIVTKAGRTQRDKNIESITLNDFGANSSLLSGDFASIADAKLAYPSVANSITSLDMTYNDLAFLLYKVWLGGSGEINLSNGTYNFNIAHDFLNYSIKCASDVTIDFTNSIDSYGFQSRGTIDAEVEVTFVDINTRVITTSTTHNYSVGDWVLLKSMTRCDTPDAGDKWQLGAGTANAAPVYFAEPVQVQAVGTNTITVARGLVFPHYSTTIDGKVATVAKMNFAHSEVLGNPTIVLPNKYFVAIEARYAKNSKFSVNFDTTVSAGTGILLMYSMANSVTGTATRPVDWELNNVDHSKFNTWKSISGWYNEFDVVEYNGSQSVDRSYSGIPSIAERFKVCSVNPKEQGITTHGMGYGTSIDAVVVNNTTSAVSNRDRFATIKLTALGNGAIAYQGNIGLNLLDFGMTDVTAEVNIVNQETGVKIDKSYSAVPYTPETVTGQIKGNISHCRYAYRLERKVPTVLSQESRFSLGANTTECLSIVYCATEDGWDNFTLSGNHQVSALATLGRAVYIRDNSFGWIIRDFTASGYPSTMTCIHIPTGSTTNKLGNMQIDWGSCKFVGSGAATTLAAHSSKQTNILSTFFTDKYQLENFSTVRLSTATTANRTITLNPSDSVIPYNKEFTILCDSLAPTITNGGVTIYGTILADAKVVKLTRVAANTYFVSSSN